MTTEDRTRTGTDLLAALALGACAFALYALSLQSSYWSDGRLLMTWVQHDEWRHYHVAYLPLAHGFQSLLGDCYGGDPERPLLWLSALSTAVAVGWTHLAARAWGAGSLASALCAGALATAPGVWFYATCVELHAPHLAAAAAVTWWCARALRGGSGGALAPALMFLTLFATHAGGALWLPALSALALRSGARWRLPRDAWLALALGLLALWGWFVVTRGLPSGRLFASQALVGALLDWRPAALWTEFAEPAALLASVGLIGLCACAPTRWFPLLVLVPYLIVVPGFGYAERGAYFSGAWPLLACGVALALERALATERPLLRGVTLFVAFLALIAQARYTRGYVADWEHAFRGHEWVEPLRRESGNRGCVIVLEAWEREAVRKHSRLDAIALRDEGRFAQAAGLSVEMLGGMLDLAFRAGGTGALTTSVIASPEGAAVVAELQRRYGPLRAASSGAYWLVPTPPRGP